MVSTFDVIFVAIVGFFLNILGVIHPVEYKKEPIQNPDSYVKVTKISEKPCDNITFGNSMVAGHLNDIDVICTQSGKETIIETGYTRTGAEKNKGIIEANKSLYVKQENANYYTNKSNILNPYIDTFIVIKPDGYKYVIFQANRIEDYYVVEGVSKVLIIYDSERYNDRIAIVDDTTGKVQREYSAESLVKFDQPLINHSVTILKSEDKVITLKIENMDNKLSKTILLNIETNDIVKK